MIPGPRYPAKAFLDEAARAQEVTERQGANRRWLNRAFVQAKADGVSAVLIAIQADMWDTTAALDAYTPFVSQLAALTVDFGRPVLRLAINPRSPAVFSSENVVFCAVDPCTS